MRGERAHSGDLVHSTGHGLFQSCAVRHQILAAMFTMACLPTYRNALMQVTHRAMLEGGHTALMDWTCPGKRACRHGQRALGRRQVNYVPAGSSPTPVATTWFRKKRQGHRQPASPAPVGERTLERQRHAPARPSPPPDTFWSGKGWYLLPNSVGPQSTRSTSSSLPSCAGNITLSIRLSFSTSS